MQLQQLQAEAARGKQQQKDGVKGAKVIATPTVDEHVPYLLTFPHGTELHEHPLVLAGALVMQVPLAVLLPVA